jgi:UDP-N-acetylglucosamine--N-acetylmuramyl-(pentapeptide) pyrophosphoryl-undecaprenol N-acetylglucosamine transferase
MVPVPLRVVVAGGGTGGHLFPGIAVARELLLRHPDAVVTFAGTAQGLESRVLPREGFALDVIRSRGLKGKNLGDRVRGLMNVPFSLLDAWRVLALRRPHLVIGVGGYSSGPLVLVAALRGLPTMLLEQNAVPGLTNRLLAPVVHAAAVTFESTTTFFGTKAFVSGNPVRPEFAGREVGAAKAGADIARSEFGVLIFGGSQGAHAINMAMVEAAAKLAAERPDIRITHQTGERDLDRVRVAYREAGVPAEVEPFLYDMGRRIAAADLIVCRAGMTTLAEIMAVGKPSILIPLPTATDDHQRRNAEALEAKGAAEMLLQAEATGARLVQRIVSLAGDPDRRRRMSQAARALARPDAARVIVDRALELAGAR